MAWPVPRAAEDAWVDTAATQRQHVRNDDNYHHLAPVSPTRGGGGGGGEYGEGDGDGAFGEVGAGGNSTCTVAAHVAAAGARIPARSAMSRWGSPLRLPAICLSRYRLSEHKAGALCRPVEPCAGASCWRSVDAVSDWLSCAGGEKAVLPPQDTVLRPRELTRYCLHSVGCRPDGTAYGAECDSVAHRAASAVSGAVPIAIPVPASRRGHQNSNHQHHEQQEEEEDGNGGREQREAKDRHDAKARERPQRQYGGGGAGVAPVVGVPEPRVTRARVRAAGAQELAAAGAGPRAAEGAAGAGALGGARTYRTGRRACRSSCSVLPACLVRP